jgi:DNA-binding CsgD family transcriptional regulator
MDEKQFEAIRSRLDAIIRLQAATATQGKTLKEQVSLLSSSGFQPKEIADLLGKTPNHISVILHELRKGKKAGEDTGESGTQGELPTGTQS